MESYILKVYRNAKELRTFVEDSSLCFSTFIFKDTSEQLECNSNIIIDITSLIFYLSAVKNDCYAAERNFDKLQEDTQIVIHESALNIALELFPCVFSSHEYICIDPEISQSLQTNNKSLEVIYKNVYTYENDKILTNFANYCNKNHIPIASFPKATDIVKNDYESFNQEYANVIIDLTSLSYAIEENKNILYLSEQFINNFTNAKFIVKTTQVEILFKFYPLYFNDQKCISSLFDDFEISESDKDELHTKPLRIVDLSALELDALFKVINHDLIGHINFKKHLINGLKNFILLNHANEQKIISIFLFGKSGIGKTEVARIINEGIIPNSYLSKINFQNYSSQDALNSLIGSPAGYIGCEHGELSEKVKKGSIGLILCDEFEKTTRPVFSYFLELLEEGKFTDSLAREYDLDGYIIIFTSNILTKQEYEKTIPPELQTRFDIVCQFEEPTPDEKKEFLELLLEKAKIKFCDQFSKINFTKSNEVELFDFDYVSIHALRDIKRKFNNKLMDFLNSHDAF